VSISKYEALVAAQPDNELLRFSLAKALYDAGRPDEAAEHFRAALALRADWMLVAMFLAKIALNGGDRAKAREYYTYALPLAIEQKHGDPEAEIRAALEELNTSEGMGLGEAKRSATAPLRPPPAP